MGVQSIDGKVEFESVNKLLNKKLAVLELVSGADRGFAIFNETQRNEIDNAVKELCEIGTPDRKSKVKLAEGMWKLVYSTNFTSNSNQLNLGQVYQKITDRRVDNIVELELPVVSTVVRATLSHSLSVEGDSFVITYKKTNVSVVSEGNSPNLTIPNVLSSLPQALRRVNSASFKNNFVDSTMRVSTGDRGELRIYVYAPE